MNARKQRLAEIDLELDALAASMESLPKDSEAYRSVQNRYGTFLQMRDDLEKSPKVIRVIREVVDTGLRVCGTIGVPLFLGWLAYNGDKDLKMVNGRVWNLVGRKFDNK